MRKVTGEQYLDAHSTTDYLIHDVPTLPRVLARHGEVVTFSRTIDVLILGSRKEPDSGEEETDIESPLPVLVQSTSPLV